MTSYVTPKKGVEYIFYVGLVSQSNTKVFQSNPTIAAGDFKVSIDGGALANPATLPAVTPGSSKMVKITLSTSEMNGDNITVVCSDAAGSEWCDLIVNIQTSARQIDDLAYPATSGRSMDVDASGGVEVGSFQTGAITAAAFAAGAIDNAAIASNAIGAAEIADNAITAAKIADGAIDSATFAAGAINAAAIAADAITDAKVASDVTIASVTGSVGSVTGNVGGNVVGSIGSVATGGITAGSIAADAIGASELAADAVAEIQSGLATSSAVSTLQTSVDDLPTNAELATALAAADDAVLAQVALVKAKTDNLPSDPADASDIAARFTTLDTAVDALPTNAELATALASADDAVLAAIAALVIPTANQNADALLDRTAGVETNRTLRQVLRIILAATAGKASGMNTATATFRDTNDTVNRIVASVDEYGNRSVVTLDAS